VSAPLPPRARNAPARPALEGALAVLNTVVVVLYPFAVWKSLTRLSARAVGLLLLALLLPGLLRLAGKKREALKDALPLPLALAALMLLAIAFDDVRLVLAYPALANGLMLALFAASLASGLPMVERFARLQVDDLSSAEIAHCRSVTIVWCAFFAANGLAAAALALFASRAVWALYTGFASYVLMGLLFASEYAVRKYRFGRFGRHPVDRFFAWLFARKAVSP
jgi:uncharacterized membrane protein